MRILEKFFVNMGKRPLKFSFPQGFLQYYEMQFNDSDSLDLIPAH